MLTYSMLTRQEQAELREFWRREARRSSIEIRSDELLDRAVKNFAAADEAQQRLEVHKYFVRGGFGFGAALLGWGGQLYIRLTDDDQPSVAQKLVKKYGCISIDFGSFPKDF